jgi:hypothetical protein
VKLEQLKGKPDMEFQQRDILRHEGQDYFLAGSPMAVFFSEVTCEAPFKPWLPGFQRGYVAGWRIADGRLYLVSIRGTFRWENHPPQEALKQLFPGPDDKVLADWFTGTVRGFRGRCRSVGEPPRRIYDTVLSLRVAEGDVLNCSVEEDRALEEQAA